MAEKPVEPAPQTEVITLSDAGDVLFDFDSAALRSDGGGNHHIVRFDVVGGAMLGGGGSEGME